MGAGHVMRCLTLADALNAAGAACLFVCREHHGNLSELIKKRGHLVRLLPPPSNDFRSGSMSEHARWLGATWEQDVKETVGAVLSAECTPDWWVIDHYAIDARWERAVLRRAGQRIMVIDDIADRAHECDVLLDQNLMRGMRTRYAPNVPERTKLLLGPEFALVRPVYAELHGRIPARDGPVKRIMVFFGGADRQDLTGRTLDAFLSLKRNDIDLDVVTTGSGQHAQSIRERAGGRSNIHLHADLPTLAPLMAQADLAIGGGGSSSWERLCLGLPTLVVTLADNQRAIANALDERKLVRWLGHEDVVTAAAIGDAMAQLLATGLDGEWSRRCFATVDGRGVDRVVSALTLAADSPLLARHARLADESMLGLGRHRETEPVAAAPAPMAPASGFRAALRMVDTVRWFVVEDRRGTAVGDIHFEHSNDQWDATYCVRQMFADGDVTDSLLKAGVFALRADVPGPIRFGRFGPGRPRRAVQGSAGAVPQMSKSLAITIASSKDSWINAMVPAFVVELVKAGHDTTWVHEACDLPDGEICFLLSFTEILSAELLDRHAHNLVVHESALPTGRGWSPLTWQVLEGTSVIPVALIEAAEEVDSGPIYLEDHIELRGDEIVDDLRRAQASTGDIPACASNSSRPIPAWRWPRPSTPTDRRTDILSTPSPGRWPNAIGCPFGGPTQLAAGIRQRPLPCLG